MKNKLLSTYLSELRFYYMDLYYAKGLDKYCGTSRKIKDEKELYETYNNNSAFDYGSSLNKVFTKSFFKDEKLVYTLAMNLYSYLENIKNDYQLSQIDKDDLGKSQFSLPNFEFTHDAVQILKILMMHFTMQYMDRYPTIKVDDSMFGIPHPDNWDFLPDTIIEDRLVKKKYFTYDVARVFSYVSTYENIELFISGKGITQDGLVLFNDKAFKAYVDYLPICNEVSQFDMKESSEGIRLSFNYCFYRGEDGEKIVYLDQFFERMNEFYVLSFQRAEEYYFDVYEYRSFTEPPVITGLESSINKFKKDGRATKKDVYNKILPTKASIFLQ